MSWVTSVKQSILLAALLIVPWLTVSAIADVIYLEAGGRIEGQIVEETDAQVVVQTPSGARQVIARDEILRIDKAAVPAAEFERRFAAIAATDVDAGQQFYELGKWAAGKGTRELASRAYRRAIEVDPDNRLAHEALGHRKHRGRWYDTDGYKKAVEGLVRWKDKWVTPSEREFYEAGFTKNDQGEWVRPEDLARQEPVRPKKPTSIPKPEVKPIPEPGGKQTPKPEVKPEVVEDTSWYDDHTTVGTWDDALRKPVESKYYKIYSNIKPEYIARYAKMLDTYSSRGFQKVFDAKKNLPRGFPKGDIYIHASQQAFMGATGMGQSVGGFYQPGQRKVVAYHGRFGSTGTTRTVIIHECTHQFEDYVLPGKMWNAPVWIIEGFAVFFESARYVADKDTVIIGHVPRDRLANLKSGLRSNTLIPLADLIRTPQPAFTGYHYAHAWGLIYYMIYGGSEAKRVRCTHQGGCKNQRRHNQRIFADLFFLARERRVTPEDLETLFGGREAFAKFEQAWKDWIGVIPYDFDPEKQSFDDIKGGSDSSKPGQGGGSSGDGKGDDEGSSTKPRQ